MKKAKRVLSVLLVCCLVTGMLAGTVLADGHHPFTDVPDDAWYSGAVQYVYEHGLMNGTGTTEFSPDATTSRGMIVTILHRLEGAPAAEGPAFADVPDGQYYTDGVAWAGANEIVGGYGNGKFGPDDPITREQFAVILYRYAKYKGYDVTASGDLAAFPDGKDVSSWAVEAMGWAVGTGLITGTDNNMLSPAGSAIRAQAATILMRFCENIVPATYSVTFDLNYDGADDPAVVTVEEGKTVAAPASPSRGEYTFDGWYTAEVGGNKFDFTTPITADLVLFAHWSLNIFSENQLPSTTPSVDSDVYSVTFETNGGSAVPTQRIKGGAKAVMPEEPEKENNTFIGWYLKNGFSDLYDFDAPVTGDITVYAKWASKTDVTDSDGDGLSDALEREFGSDPTKDDTDDDGVSDFDELNWLRYDPTSPDSNGNGVLDSEEDPDNDKLTNAEESQYGTNPIYFDTDGDRLSDYDELKVYHTDPLNQDTDGDGVPDGVELELASDPNVVESRFTTKASSGNVDEFTPVTASAKIVTDSKGAGTLTIHEISAGENPLISQNIAGYLGFAYDFSADGFFESAVITFEYDPALGQIGDDFQPRIYYVNEETGMLEELPDQTVEDGMVSVNVSHFSTYVLLNKVDFDAVWNEEIKPPLLDDGSDENEILDVVFVIDYSNSMNGNDPDKLYKRLSHEFIDKLRDGKDRGAVIKFIKRETIVSALTTDKDELKRAIDSIRYNNGFGLDAGTNGSAGLKAALEILEESSTKYKYIIFITDGEDTYSSYSYDDLITASKEQGITIFSVGMGTANETVLVKLADETGGKYYHATTSVDTEDLIDLEDVFKDIEAETVDLTTDSNDDGIPDYYIQLLNDGDLALSNGTLELVDVLGMYGETNDDWDNDGLKNGEEIEICHIGSWVYARMISNPLLVDTDGDGYSDALEKEIGTPPMSVTSSAYGSLKNLKNDDLYVYVDVANDKGVLATINGFFDWQKKDESKDQLIDYFYDYASKETIDANQEKIAKLKQREEYLKYAQSLANVFKTAKNVCSIADDVSGMIDGVEDKDTANEFITEARNKTIQLKGASAQIRRSRKTILDALNTEELESKDILKTVLSDMDTTISTVEEFSELFEKYDAASFTKDITALWSKTSAEISVAVGTVKSCYDGFRYMQLDTGFKKISDGYKDFLKKKGVENNTSTYVSAALDVVDGALDIWDTCNTYGKMKANRDAYTAYIDLLHYIAEHADEEYSRVAAGDIVKIIEDETWKEYESQLKLYAGKTVVLTTLNIVLDVCPYTKTVKTVADLAKLAISVTGLSNNARMIVSCRNMKAVSDGCIAFIDSSIRVNDPYFSYDNDIEKYITQLAQCRLVGEDCAKDRMLKGDLAMLLSRWLKNISKEEIEELFRTKAGSLYTSAKRLELVLSTSLPYYNDFNGASSSMGGR